MNTAAATNTAVLFDAASRCWLQFEEPAAIYAAYDLAAVHTVLEQVESAVAENNFAVGFIAYEAAPAFDPALAVNSVESFPLAWFAIYPQARELAFPQVADGPPIAPGWQLSINDKKYRADLAQVKRYIHAGETYQVNYTFRLRAPFPDDPWQLFVQMIHAQGYGYGAFIDTGDYCICSASHELFFSCTGGRLASRPMKGTVPRGLSAEADRAQADWLKESLKNRAENLMIVDMVRNDMSRIADTGSVTTTSLFDLEKYPTLWQMTSTVQATTRSGISRIMQALFPPASITGAPKARTMGIIAELENEPRKIYTGTIGLVKPDRSAQFNVAIRTVLVDKRNHLAEYGVGGGIVWDSETQNELEECYTKARVLTYVQGDFDLLETLLWTPQDGFFLLPLHLQRLLDSADYFSRPADPDLIRERLAAAAGRLPPVRHRVRLRLTRTGEPLIEARPLTPHAGAYRVHLAARAVDTDDVFLYHKTSRRGTYAGMLAGFPDYDDVLLFNRQSQVTESCIANVVVELNGELVTPPVHCGLLAGVYRRHLLEQGRIREKVITLADLPRCTRISLINSVRGSWDVTLSS